jgi:O-antigen ligase
VILSSDETRTKRSDNVPFGVQPAAAPGKWQVFSTTLNVFCVCIGPLSTSPEHYLMWVGRIAIIAGFLASAVSLFLGRKNNLYLAPIAITILSLIAVGLVAADMHVPQTYVQVLQILIFGTIVAEHRKLQVSPSLCILLLAVITAAAGLNFAFPAPVKGDDTHSFSQMVGVFGNPNVLAMFCCTLFMLVFSLLRTALLTWQLTLSYLACGTFAYLVISTGGRSALLALLVYLAVYGTGRFLKGNKRMMRLMAPSMLLLVPVITIAYPMAFGKQIRFTTPPVSCMMTTIEACRNSEIERPSKADDLPKMTDGGYFGINKNLASGRQNIWPTLIELSGDRMIWGHGLGSLPGAYLAWPYHGRSAHNGFLQVYFQFGLVGTALYLFLWLLLFVRASNIPDIVARSTAVAALCAICTLEIFEVVLIQNLFGIGVALAIVATTEFVRNEKMAAP